MIATSSNNPLLDISPDFALEADRLNGEFPFSIIGLQDADLSSMRLNGDGWTPRQRLLNLLLQKIDNGMITLTIQQQRDHRSGDEDIGKKYADLRRQWEEGRDRIQRALAAP